ncbi:YgiQ family radical SAM protein [Clostridia bacterium]|nr:YgiQ family radical SAM protein [Clostridia bacterium]
MTAFLPVTRDEMTERGWYWYDFLLVTGDAYVDHPSFGAAVIGRVLERAGYRVAALAQPKYGGCGAFSEMGKPRRGVMITGGNVDSMVARYTAANKPRSEDDYSPEQKAGLRPDRAVLVYAKLAREAFPETRIILGGLEASLRRFAHYDYWDDAVRGSYLVESGADVLVYGMGERTVLEVASGKDLASIRGICYTAESYDGGAVRCHSLEEVQSSRRKYAAAFMQQYNEQDAATGKVVIQPHGGVLLIQNPPAPPLETDELDSAAALPYTRAAHPRYKNGIKAVEEVRFSIIHNRGCFGGCNFCSIAFHQGREVTARSHASVLAEAEKIAALPDFKGYIHDVGGPTANWRRRSCSGQRTRGMCRHKSCLAPKPCPKADLDGADYLSLLRKLRNVKGVKKVFVRSGLRYDALMTDKSALLEELVQHHVSGQLKVAPEHCVPGVLDAMGKPHWEAFIAFEKRFAELNESCGKQQFLVPYLISSHPGSTLKDAVKLAETLNAMGCRPEQVQDFYPTPGTLSTCMYYTGFDPRTMKPIYVPRSPKDKAMQRALLQWNRPEKRALVLEALRRAGRMDLVGFGKRCLIRPERRKKHD